MAQKILLSVERTNQVDANAAKEQTCAVYLLWFT
jgi:hypothetical protein